MVAEEAIMICIDNSRWMTFFENRYSFKLQLNCVRLYCRAKFKSNPKNAIGILTMCTEDHNNRLEPTSDLDKILDHLKKISHSDICKLRNGELDFVGGLGTSRMILERKYSSNSKRMLFFTGGPTVFGMHLYGKSIGEDLKRWGIAVDVVNFWLHEEYDYWITGLEELVAAANDNNNNKSHIKHLQPCIWTLARDVLSSIIYGACSLEEEERRCLEANEAPNTNDLYHAFTLERIVKQKEEYMALGLKGAVQIFVEFENRELESQQLERSKHDPHEVLHRLLLEAERGGGPHLELVFEEKKSILKAPLGVVAETGVKRKRKPQRKLIDNNSILKVPGVVVERSGKHSMLMYVYSVSKTTPYDNIMNLCISICLCGCLLATYWLVMC